MSLKMTPPKFYEDEERSLEENAIEKTPGVYVRTNEQAPNELDVLWSGTRNFGREDRSPLVFVFIGLVLGSVLTSAVFLLFINKPEITTLGNKLTAPIGAEKELMSGEEGAKAQTGQAGEQTAGTAASGVAAVGKTYEVQSGDTLGKIALQFYGSSEPALVERIVRANNLSSAHAITIGQKLVLPPKNY